MHLESILQSNLELQHPLLGLLRSFLPCSWPKGIQWFSDTKSKVALDFSHTNVWGWFGCDSTYQCRTVPCCSILCGCWPGAGLVLGNESSDISSLLLEAGLLLVSRSSWCISVPTSLCLSLHSSSAVFVDLGEERPFTPLQTNFPSSCHLPTCSSDLKPSQLLKDLCSIHISFQSGIFNFFFSSLPSYKWGS